MLLEQKLIEKNIGLLCIDPIVGYFDSNKDMNKGTDVRQLMNSLHQLAKRLEIGIICVRHWNKSKDVSAGSRGSGSVDFRNASRSCLSVAKGVDGKCYLGLSKSNYSAQAKTLIFSLQKSESKKNESLFVWEGETEQNIDDVIASQFGTEENSQIGEAIDFLKDMLGGKSVPAAEVQKYARELGISDTTLKRARKQLGVTACQVPGQKGWFNSLPDNTERAGGSEGHRPRPLNDDPLSVDDHVIRRQLGLL